MNNGRMYKKLPLIGINSNELGAVSVEHLWADIFALKIKVQSVDGLCNLEEVIQEALSAAKNFNAKTVIYRLKKGEIASERIVQFLPTVGFSKKNERIEFKKSIVDLPGDKGSPLDWKTAKELGLSPDDIAHFLKQIALGDPDTEPGEDPIQFIQDFLSDPILTAGLDCIHVGFLKGEAAALTVVQREVKTGWCRISYMGVLPNYRGQKLGHWVHRHGFQIMKNEGGLIYQGGTLSSNHGMLRLFEVSECVQICEIEEWRL